MSSLIRSVVVATFALAVAPAQERVAGVFYRDFSLVQRLRVVCSDKHFGRLDDLIVELPSGRVRAAVVSIVLDKGLHTVLVPYEGLQYEPSTNLLQLGNCLQKEEAYPPFDATAVKIVSKARDDGQQELEGTMLVSRLARSGLALAAAGVGSVQGLTLELGSGHVAFVDAAVGKERAGDGELHPVPWSALRLQADATADGAKLPLLALNMTKEALAAAPNLVEIIVQSPLYRARVYAFFAVRRPAFDTEG